jgi:hypothetical protein
MTMVPSSGALRPLLLAHLGAALLGCVQGVGPSSPDLVLTPAAVTFNATAGGANPPSQTITVTSGTFTVAGLTLGVTYGTGQPTGWLAAILASSSTPAGVTLLATTGSLAAGTYTATVSVSSPAANIAAKTAAVTFVVAP